REQSAAACLLAVTARRAVNVEDDCLLKEAQGVSGDAGVSAPQCSRDSRSVGRTFLLEYGLLAASEHLVADDHGRWHRFFPRRLVAAKDGRSPEGTSSANFCGKSRVHRDRTGRARTVRAVWGGGSHQPHYRPGDRAATRLWLCRDGGRHSRAG